MLRLTFELNIRIVFYSVYCYHVVSYCIISAIYRNKIVSQTHHYCYVCKSVETMCHLGLKLFC